ncbi:hypothetical protein HHI36_019746 [Cryptolaemus montrouzieri]|uniref:Uncharacterized protein n=1 Tax=Cryptolaemus montrouzieri TaxID=559131 RepID=A0ABD2N8B2_9CUCU
MLRPKHLSLKLQNRHRGRTPAIRNLTEEEKTIEQAILRLLEQRKKKEIRCWNCDQTGHMRMQYEKPSQGAETGKLNEVDDKGHESTHSSHAPEIVIREATPSDRSSLYVFYSVNDKSVHLLIDNGTTKTIMGPDVLLCEKPTKRRVPVKLLTATGQEIPMHGILRVNLEIGSRVVRHEVIAADIAEEVILGMDVIKRCGFNPDLKKDVLRIDNEEIPISDAVNVTLKRDTAIAENRPLCAVIGTVTSPASSSRNKCQQQLLDLLTFPCHDLDNQQTIRI